MYQRRRQPTSWSGYVARSCQLWMQGRLGGYRAGGDLRRGSCVAGPLYKRWRQLTLAAN
jgi:hypothetical protein